ncbi:hypothetical protein TTHERM_00485970 (macronuclear) [Tetrahymena thermophila SB210]|uniref:Uncharacterized protein n=1 Tax=Tetrahymena thermophila (strain SB210) TaxID=312017 RepID=I7M6G2_TETTS|nr:hypothetical protein TTHERM_00485970 [Tetrahymena thermophila SB210]EAR85147.2 hypothetical protein TTHERM_00485970 [Tetrahymena thermophila SB210]|eukprot:XP_001032810.2 hypothetical protein TTHERM_00485970 [Tetrahymena thermophila SB210]
MLKKYSISQQKKSLQNDYFYFFGILKKYINSQINGKDYYETEYYSVGCKVNIIQKVQIFFLFINQFTFSQNPTKLIDNPIISLLIYIFCQIISIQLQQQEDSKYRELGTMQSTKEIENINKILIANNALVKNKIDSQRQSYANLTNESVTDGEDNSSHNFYKINNYSSSFDTKIKGPSSVSSVTRDRFMDFEEMSVGDAMPSGKREGQQSSFHQTYQFILGTPKYRNNSCANNSNNGGSKVSLISSKKSEVSGSDEDNAKIFMQQLRILQNKVNQQENQMKNMDQKCEEVKKENNELKKNLDKITKENEDKKLAEKDQEIQRLQIKNTQLQEQFEKMKENYENRISDYQNLIDDLNQQLLDKENQVEETKRQLSNVQKKMSQQQEQNQQLLEKVKNLEDLIEKQVDINNDEVQKNNNIHKLSQQSSMNYPSFEKQDFNHSQGKSASSIYSSILPNKRQTNVQLPQQMVQTYDKNILSMGQSNKSSQNNSKLEDQQLAFQQQIQVNQQFLQNQVNIQQQIMQQQQLQSQQSKQEEEMQALQQNYKLVHNKPLEEDDLKIKKERSRSQQSSRCRSPWGDTMKFEILSNNNFSEFNQTKNDLDLDDEIVGDQKSKFNPSSTIKSISQITNSVSKNYHNTSLRQEETDNFQNNSNNKLLQQLTNQNNSGCLNISKFRKNSRNSKQIAVMLINQQSDQIPQMQKQQQFQQEQSLLNQKLIYNPRLNQTIDQVRCRSEQRNIISPVNTIQTIHNHSNNDSIISPISGKMTNKSSKRGGSNITVDLRLTLNNQNQASQTLDNSFANQTNQNNSFIQPNGQILQVNSNNYVPQANNNNNNNSYSNQLNQAINLPINSYQINPTNNFKNQLNNKPPSRSKSRQEDINQNILYQSSALQCQPPAFPNNISNIAVSKNDNLHHKNIQKKDQQNSSSLSQQQNKGKGYRIKNDSPSPLSQKKSDFRSIDNEMQHSLSASRKNVVSQQSNYLQQKSPLNSTLQAPSRSPQSSHTQSNSQKRQSSLNKNQKLNLTLNSNYLSSNSQTPNNANTNSNSTKSKKGSLKNKIQKYQSLNADDYNYTDTLVNNKPKFQTITPSSQSSNACSTAHTNSSNNMQYQAIFLQNQLQYQQNYFNSIDAKDQQQQMISNKNNSKNLDQKMVNQIYQNQRAQNNRSPLQKRIKSTNSPSIQFYDGSKQNIMNKTMNYVDVTNYLENHGLQQSVIDENSLAGICSAKNSTNTTNSFSQSRQMNNNNNNFIPGGNILRQSAQLQNQQNLANLNSAHLRSRSEQAQYNQKKQQQVIQQQINDQLNLSCNSSNNNNNNRKKQLSLLSNEDCQNRTPTSLYDGQMSKASGASTNKNQLAKQQYQQNLNINLGLSNYEIIEQTIESQTSSSIKSRQKNK